ncbi:MAG: FHA domain-containing protein [Bdellovibrionia bacterium]
MYKLTIVAGPNPGSSFVMHEGENSVGRQPGNSIVLSSSKVSKSHCVLSVNQDDITLKDAGSSNGTFVNGSLVKVKKLKVGDRISIGEFVLEISHGFKKTARPLPLPKRLPVFNALPQGISGGEGLGAQAPSLSPISSDLSHSELMPTDLKGKLIWIFEKQIMPVFYGINVNYEWRAIGVMMLVVFALLNLTVSVYPLLESNRVSLTREIGRRASFMAKQIAETNAPFLANRMETKSEIGIIETAEGVRSAVLIDLDSRIIAPSSRLNQYLAGGVEGAAAVNARDRFRAGKETGYWVTPNDTTLVAIEPIKVYNPNVARNVVVAMALVSMDLSVATPDLGEMGVVYSEVLCFTAMILGVIFLILYKITLKPFQVLNEDIDRALKGSISQVTHEFKIEELDSLWEIINSMIQRVSRSGSGGDSAASASLSSSEIAAPLKALGQLANFGMVLFDSEKKILFVNSVFEEMSGIRQDNALGQEISSVARDQALGAFVSDLMSRVLSGSESLTEDFDFSGVPCKVHFGAIGASGAMAQCFVMATTRVE